LKLFRDIIILFLLNELGYNMITGKFNLN